jgi:hypothetical protein
MGSLWNALAAPVRSWAAALGPGRRPWALLCRQGHMFGHHSGSLWGTEEVVFWYVFVLLSGAA